MGAKTGWEGRRTRFDVCCVGEAKTRRKLPANDASMEISERWVSTVKWISFTITHIISKFPKFKTNVHHNDRVRRIYPDRRGKEYFRPDDDYKHTGWCRLPETSVCRAPAALQLEGWNWNDGNVKSIGSKTPLLSVVSDIYSNAHYRSRGKTFLIRGLHGVQQCWTLTWIMVWTTYEWKYWMRD